MRLRGKLLLAQLPLVAALVVTGVAAGAILASLGRASQHILEDNYRSVLATQRMKEAIERMDSAALFVLAGDRRGLEAARQHERHFEEELRVQEGNLTERGEREATAALRARWDAYRGRFDRLAAGADGDARAYYFAELLPRFTAVKQAADEVLALNQDTMVRRSDDARSKAEEFGAALLGLFLAAAAVAVLAATALITRLVRPLGRLSLAARRIGQGDLASRASAGGSDEVADLARELDTMADRLQQYRRSSLGELIEAQQAAQAAIDSLPDPVVVLGEAGGLRQVNRAAATLLQLDPDAGDRGLHDAEPEVRAVIDAVRLHVASGRGAYVPRGLEEAIRVVTAEGERRYLARGAALYGESGAVVGVTVVLQDVSRLLRFDQLKTDLVATVAHELRTPLTSLRMAIHLCAEEVVGPLNDKQADLVHAAREDCERLQSMVDELLDVSRIQAGRVELRPTAIDPAALVDAAVEGQRAIAAQRSIALRSQVLPGTGEVMADPERAQLVLTNLIANAVRYGPSGEEVTIGAVRTGDWIRFAVTDRGPGVAREHRQAIFERFFRAPGSASGGAGLGLFIARELVTAHGGEIGVDDGPRGGSTFWFTLPASPA